MEMSGKQRACISGWQAMWIWLFGEEDKATSATAISDARASSLQLRGHIRLNLARAHANTSISNCRGRWDVTLVLCVAVARSRRFNMVSIPWRYALRAIFNPGHHSAKSWPESIQSWIPLTSYDHAGNKTSPSRPRIHIAVAAGERCQIIMVISAKVDCFLYSLACIQHPRYSSYSIYTRIKSHKPTEKRTQMCQQQGLSSPRLFPAKAYKERQGLETHGKQ